MSICGVGELHHLHKKLSVKNRRKKNLADRRSYVEERANTHPEITQIGPARQLFLDALARHNVTIEFADDPQIIASLCKSLGIQAMLIQNLDTTHRFKLFANMLDSVIAGSFVFTGKKVSNRKAITGLSKGLKGQFSVAGIDVRSDDFLTTYAWRTLRYEVLKKFGAKCQCCGATPASGVIINIDHIKPRRMFPELAMTVENLQVLCNACNHGKGNSDQTDWRDSGV